ncbi:MAG: hypothetical protein EPO08_20650 [Rhodospirillaceae bacterium]|nr:MAG: hypothetical protein EPO08_20650 [Rhodospirillaceae bacterium]
MDPIQMFPDGWQTQLGPARESAGAVGARVAGLKYWPDEDVRLYQGMVDSAYQTCGGTASKFFKILGDDLRQYAPNPVPPGWGDLYRYAVSAQGTTLSAEDQAWLNSLPAQLLGAGAKTAADVKAGLTAAGDAAVNLVNAGANVANTVAKAPGGGLMIGGIAIAGLLWAMS